jgi:hypothetical protein
MQLAIDKSLSLKAPDHSPTFKGNWLIGLLIGIFFRNWTP